MGTINIKYEAAAVDSKFRHLALPLNEYLKFGPATLGLGDLAREGESVDVLAANLDLQGFTDFSAQMEPQIVVPEFLNDFLTWLFKSISMNFCKEKQGDKVILWGKLPCYSKFLGDGIVFIWDTRGLSPASIGNIVINLYRIREEYVTKFLPEREKFFSKIPSRLRCGIARGQVVSLGGGRDFIGPCINMASRLQKLSLLSFAFPRKGFDPDACFSSVWKRKFVAKSVKIRGLRHEEVVFIDRDEFEALPDEEKGAFSDL